MARPLGGSYTAEKSRPVATRLPVDIYDKALALAGGKDGFTSWLRGVVKDAVGARAIGTGASQLGGYEEGKRQGWAHANKVFREALGEAAEKLK